MDNVIDSEVDDKVFENFVAELGLANRTCQTLEAFDISCAMFGITAEDIDELIALQNDRTKTVDIDILN